MESLKVSTNPSFNDASAIIKHALEDGRMLLIAGRCEVVYEGRASSKLGLAID